MQVFVPHYRGNPSVRRIGPLCALTVVVASVLEFWPDRRDVFFVRRPTKLCAMKCGVDAAGDGASEVLVLELSELGWMEAR